MLRLLIVPVTLGAFAPRVVGQAPQASNEANTAETSGISDERPPGYLLAASEMVVALGIGTAWYWLDREHNIADWDYDSWAQRLDTDAFRYDNNVFAINWVFHPMSGAAFYGLSRANDLSVPISYAYAFLTSGVWEYLLEFREKVSINDSIVTPTAGLVFGEFFHQLGRYLSSAPQPSRWQRALAWSAGFPIRVHERIRGVDHSFEPVDRYGFSARWYRRFDLRGGAVAQWSARDFEEAFGEPRSQRRSAYGELRFRGELAALPGYLGPRSMRRWVRDGAITRLDARIPMGAGGGIELDGETMWLGYHAQEDFTDRAGAITIGSTVTYRYHRLRVGGFTDRLGVLGLPGLSADGRLRYGSTTFRARAAVHGDFAGIHAASYELWESENPEARSKSALRKESYYYGWGWSLRTELSASGPWGELGFRLWRGRHSSHEGLDRAQEVVDQDVRVRDTSMDLEAWAQAILHPRSGLFLELEVRHQDRRSTIDDGIPGRRHRTNVGVGIGLRR